MIKLPNYLLLPYLFIPLFVTNLLIIVEQQFIYLAYSFTRGSLSLIQLPPAIADLSYFEGKYYWPLGPFPAISLIPFVWLFKTNFLQGLIQFPVNVINFWLIYKISKLLNLPTNKSLLLTIFYIFGSIYTPVAAIPFSWHFAQVIATTLLLFALYEFLTQKRWAVISIALAFAILTRATLLASCLFFLIFLIKKPLNLSNLIRFSFPLILAIFTLGAYNFYRFGDFLESGYSYQIIPEEPAQRRSHGLFSLKHIPANLYYMLIKTPDPVLLDNSHVLTPPYLRFDNYGMSIFFLSPVLFLVFKANYKDKLVRASLITTIAILIPIITYYGIGYKQVGYRYALDFFPFLLILLTSAAQKISPFTLKLLIIPGVIITWFFIFEKLSGF